MINLRKFVVAAPIMVLCAACSGGTPSRPLQPELSSDTVNAIAECSGGYQKNAVAQLRAEWQGRGGEVIAGAGLTEGGGSLLTIGNLQGKDAIDFYNAYVICIDKRSKDQTIRAKEREGEVEISRGSVEWEEAGMFSKYDWTGNYTYIVQNSSRRSKQCKLFVRGVLVYRSTKKVYKVSEKKIHSFTITSNTVEEISGEVGVEGFTSGRKIVSIKRDLVCS